MVEIVAIEPCKRLRFELLQRQRLRIAERPSDHLFDAVAAKPIWVRACSASGRVTAPS